MGYEDCGTCKHVAVAVCAEPCDSCKVVKPKHQPPSNWEERVEIERTLKFIGIDSWSRPVYEDENGKLWKNVSLKLNEQDGLYSANNNAFDGEPDCPMNNVTKVHFVGGEEK